MDHDWFSRSASTHCRAPYFLQNENAVLRLSSWTLQPCCADPQAVRGGLFTYKQCRAIHVGVSLPLLSVHSFLIFGALVIFLISDCWAKYDRLQTQSLKPEQLFCYLCGVAKPGLMDAVAGPSWLWKFQSDND